MNRSTLLLIVGCFFLSTTAFSQLKYSLQAMPEAYTYGIYVKPCGEVIPSSNTITGTAQVTIVLPLGNNAINLEPKAGIWQESGSVSGPEEAPGKNYFSFGFLTDAPPIVYEAGKETLLFTFQVEGTGVPGLLNNETDPFAVFPNSVNSNPGNEISVIDIGATPISYYYYAGNYSPDDPESCPSATDPDDDNDDDDDGENPPTSTLEEVGKESFFFLSPNPTSNIINVNFTNKDAYQESVIRLWTAQGVSIGNKKRNSQSQVQFNVSMLPAGLYFLSLEADGKVLQRDRFMKQ